jgi:hypothetical protein
MTMGECVCILACIILFIIYYQVKITVINEDKSLKYLTIDLFVVTYFFIVTLLIIYTFFARLADMGNCDVANIMPCKFCIITTNYMIKDYY